MKEVTVFLEYYLIQPSHDNDVDNKFEYALSEHLCFTIPYLATYGELLRWEHPLEDLCRKTFQRILNDYKHDDRREEDGPLVWVRLSALWILVVQLSPVVDDLNNVHESPSSAQNDPRVEQYALIAHD